MPKIQLQPNPTFEAKVGLSMAGQEKPVEAGFVFKYRNKDEAQAFYDRLQAQDKPGNKDADLVADCVVGWKEEDFDQPFTAENLLTLQKNYPNAALEIVLTYLREVAGSKAKN